MGCYEASSSQVVAWGDNALRQTDVPAGLTNVIAIAAGANHNLALKADGTAVAWGYNFYSQTNVPASASNLVAIAGGNNHSVALRSNGTVVAWGRQDYQQTSVLSGAINVIAIAAGGEHCLALRNDGRVVAWGAGSFSGSPHFGQTRTPTSLTNAIAIAAGTYHSVALRSDGTVVAWGLNGSGQTNVPVNLTNVAAIAAGGSNTVALKRDGTVVAWGNNTYGQTNVPTGLTNVVALRVGEAHVHALQADGTLIGWGRNAAGQLNYPSLANVAAIAAGRSHALALEVDSGLSILSSPADLNLLPGSTATMSVSAFGAPPLFYQWQRDGADLVGETKASLHFTNAQFPDEGSYRVIVSNHTESVTSADAVVRVFDLARALDATNLVWTISGGTNAWFPQTAVTHDGRAAARSATSGFSQTARLQTTVVGPGTLSYWWMLTNGGGFNTFSFSTETTNLATYSGIGWQQRIHYFGPGTNILRWSVTQQSFQAGAGYLDQVSYTPGTAAPTILTAPTSGTLPAGTNVTFTVRAGGTPPLHYQWYFQGDDLAGATTSSFKLENIQGNHVGDYSVIVTNQYGTISASASLAVTDSAPSIWTQPTSQEMVRGGTVTFSLLVRGSEPLSYQWYFNGTSIENENGPVLTLSRVQTNHVGVYSVSVSNAFGGVLSTNVTFTIVPTVIVGWGSVFTSSPNPPLGLNNVAAIAGGDNYSVALRDDGTVFAWGWDAFSRIAVPPGLSNVTKIAAGGFHGSTLKRDGIVVNWGNGSIDAAVNVPVGLSNVVDIAAGYRFNLALKRDGTVSAWGDNFSFPLIPPAGLSNVVSIAAGRRHSLALKSDGRVTAWGDGNAKQINLPASLTNALAVSGGVSHSMALRSDGTVEVWGDSVCTNIPADINDIISIASGDQHCLALRSNGTVAAWGINLAGQTNVPPWLTNVVAVSGGYQHSLALLNDGSPFVTRQPWTQTILPGMNARFDAVALGQAPLSYQWQLNGQNILGATNSLLIISNAPMSASGSYHCVITNDIGSAASLPALLTVLRTAPRFEWSSPAVDPNGNLNLIITGLSGHGDVVVYASTNLTHWEPVHTNGPTIGSLFFNPPGPAQGSHRFYQLEER